MRFYTKQHKFYCGIDLHTKKMYVCIINNAGEILLHRHEVKRSANMKTDRNIFLKVIEPYQEDVAAAVECMFTWYWIADLCAQKGILLVSEINYDTTS